MGNLKEDLKIVISGDPSAFNKALKEAEANTKRLEASLSATAKISGVAFAALTGTVYGLVKAWREDEQAQIRTAAVLKSTGGAAGVTAEQVDKLSTALQDVTTFSDGAVNEAQNVLLTFNKIGKDIFPKATEATLDLATSLGKDAPQAAKILGIALNDPISGVGKLRAAGVDFSVAQERMIKALVDTGQQAKAQKMILEELARSTGGSARAAADGTGAFLQLQNSFSNVASALGKELSPVLESAAKKLNAFLIFLRDNEAFLKTAAAAVGMGVAVTGIVFALSTAAVGILKFVNVTKAAVTAFKAMEIGVKGFLGAAGIGLLILVITDLAVNFDLRMKQISAIWNGVIKFFTESSGALSKILYGVFNFDLDALNKGLEQIKASVSAAAQTVATEWKAAGDQEVADNQTKNEAIQTQTQTHVEALLASQVYYLEQQKKLKDDALAVDNEARLSDQELEQLQAQDHANIMGQLVNQNRADTANVARAYQEQQTKDAFKEQQTRLMDEQKSGKNIAAAKALFRSKEFQATEETFSSLQTLSQSHNKNLFRIGQIAAIAGAVVNTAKGVTNALAAYPPPFSFIAAAAQAAAGAVQISAIKSQGLNEGGMVSGGITGRDSVPAMLTPGELVAPAKNFDEVVNAVAAQRANQNRVGQVESGAGGQMEITVGFKDDAFEIIEKKLIQRRVIGVGSF